MIGFLLIVVLIGIPGIAGAILIAEAPDRNSISSGGSLLVYAGALSATFAYTVPVGGVTGAQYFIMIPVILAGSIVVGAIIGLLRRNKADRVRILPAVRFIRKRLWLRFEASRGHSG